MVHATPNLIPMRNCKAQGKQQPFSNQHETNVPTHNYAQKHHVIQLISARF